MLIVDDETHIHQYIITHDVTTTLDTISTLAIIKRQPVLDTALQLQAQLQIVNFPNVTGAEGGLSPYETLHSLIKLAVSPYFDQLPRTRDGHSADKAVDGDTKPGVPMAKKRLAELELSLLQLQQNTEISEVVLAIHPIIHGALANALADNTRPSVSHVSEELLTDSTFLNHLQNNVNSWIKAIQQITKKSRDPGDGSASQEISFWIGMEDALADVEKQLKSDAVMLTLDVLKQAKRFHATVSFIADTGLKEAHETGITRLKRHGLSVSFSLQSVDARFSARRLAKRNFDEEVYRSSYPDIQSLE